MVPIRMRLRDNNAAAHLALEAVMALDPATITIEQYGRALQTLQAVRAGWQPRLQQFLPDVPRPHLGWLAADLERLGLPDLAAAPPPPIASAAEAWGVRYVLEGSALGGRVLLRAVTPFGFTADSGARYFAGHGSDTGRRWTAFLAQLDAVATAEATPDILRGASAGFHALTEFAAETMVPASL